MFNVSYFEKLPSSFDQVFARRGGGGPPLAEFVKTLSITAMSRCTMFSVSFFQMLLSSFDQVFARRGDGGPPLAKFMSRLYLLLQCCFHEKHTEKFTCILALVY